MIVSRFGLHIAGGIPFLLQRSGTQNLISPELRAPFEVQIRPRNARCQHGIDLTQSAPAPDWINHPLAQVFIPVPRREGDTAKLILDPDRKLLTSLAALARLSTPTEEPIRPVWWRKALHLAPPYELTNLGPLVWTQGDVARTHDIVRHIELARVHRRRILIVCDHRVPVFEDIEWIEPFDVPADAPFEQIGAGLLRQHMMEIQNGGSF